MPVLSNAQKHRLLEAADSAIANIVKEAEDLVGKILYHDEMLFETRRKHQGALAVRNSLLKELGTVTDADDAPEFPDCPDVKRPTYDRR